MYVPTLRKNLMSVKKLTKAGVKVLFKDNKVTLMMNEMFTPLRNEESKRRKSASRK